MICGFYQQRNRVLENIVWLALTFTNCSQTERLFPDNPSWNERFGSRGHIVAPKGPGGPISSPLSVTRTLLPVTAVERGSAESDKVACTLGMYAVGTGTRLAHYYFAGLSPSSPAVLRHQLYPKANTPFGKAVSTSNVS